MGRIGRILVAMAPAFLLAGCLTIGDLVEDPCQTDYKRAVKRINVWLAEEVTTIERHLNEINFMDLQTRRVAYDMAADRRIELRASADSFRHAAGEDFDRCTGKSR